MQSFLSKKFFLEKNVVLLPNGVPKLSGSPRSNPSAGKRSDAAILVWQQASGSLMLPGMPMLLHGKLNQLPKIQRLVPKGYFRKERLSPPFHSASFYPTPRPPSQRWIFFLWSNELLTCLSGDPSVVPDPLASPHTHPNCSLMKAERKPM